MKKILFFLALIIAVSCSKSTTEYEAVYVYFSKDGEPASYELIFDDAKASPGETHSFADVYKIPKSSKSDVKVDYGYEMGGLWFSKRKSYFLERDIKEIKSYQIIATGNVDEPLLITEIISEGGGNEPLTSGNWKRSDGGSYMKLTGTQVFVCNANTGAKFSGTFSPSQNRAVLTQGSVSLEFWVYLENETRLRVEQYVSGSYVSTDYYNKVNNYPC